MPASKFLCKRLKRGGHSKWKHLSRMKFTWLNRKVLYSITTEKVLLFILKLCYKASENRPTVLVKQPQNGSEVSAAFPWNYSWQISSVLTELLNGMLGQCGRMCSVTTDWIHKLDEKAVNGCCFEYGLISHFVDSCDRDWPRPNFNFGIFLETIK